MARAAELAAAEVERLAKRGAAGPPEREKTGYGWSFVTHLGTVLLNRLQFRVRDVHLAFRSGASEVRFLGVHMIQGFHAI